MSNKIRENQQGTTILEIVVALAIFSTIVVMAVGIFQAVLISQQSAVSAQNKQESLKYIFEVVSKDIRSAIRGNNDCQPVGADAAVNKIYNRDTALNTESDILYFKDKDGACTYYEISNGTFIITKDGTVSSTTPRDVIVTSFKFDIVDNPIVLPINTVQPRVTFSIEIAEREGREIERQPMTVQTTISSRYYE